MGTGNDLVYGGAGADNIYGGDNDDTLFGEGDSDSIRGDGGNDRIVGGGSNDILYGGDGDDVFIVNGLDGWDSFTGDAGTDTIRIENVDAAATVAALAVDFINGIERIENDYIGKPGVIFSDGYLDLTGVFLEDISELRGGNWDDTIYGTSVASNSSLIDNINGFEGNDTLAGGAGNDKLTGGIGADTFLFATNEGTDRVIDFANGTDKIDLRNTSSTGIGDLVITPDGSNTQIVVDFTTIVLEGVAVANVDSTDFIF